MILVQHILLQWGKDCRGGPRAARRSQFLQAAKLPADFFDYIPFGHPVHWVLMEQKQSGINVKMDRRGVEAFDSWHSLRLSPMELTLKDNGHCEIRYRYDWHKGAIPGRYQYDRTGGRAPLNEPAFELCAGEYGRAICNGRFVDWDTGAWWYELSVTNVLMLAGKRAPLDCFLTHIPTHYYRQIAQLR